MRFFLTAWAAAKQVDLDYGSRDSWEKLNASGQGLLQKFMAEQLPLLSAIEASEKVFELQITSLDLPFIGVIDLIANLDGKRTVVDFKTSAAAYEEHEVILSDQLSAYQLAEPQASQTALCVLVKTKEPKIECHLSTRSGDRLTEFLSKAGYIAHEIQAGRFYTRPSKWCSWCDFLSLCTGDTDAATKTLIRIH